MTVLLQGQTKTQARNDWKEIQIRQFSDSSLVIVIKYEALSLKKNDRIVPDGDIISQMQESKLASLCSMTYMFTYVWYKS